MITLQQTRYVCLTNIGACQKMATTPPTAKFANKKKYVMTSTLMLYASMRELDNQANSKNEKLGEVETGHSKEAYDGEDEPSVDDLGCHTKGP
jgi:hypothetical protein